MTAEDLVLETDALTKRYGERVAVDEVNMTVRRGEVYGFLGPNGAGKTTTLRMALGLVRPSSGRVQLLGRPAGGSDATARVGALIEGPGFHPYLSGRDNLSTLARYRRIASRNVTRVLELVDLTARAADKYRSYSLGMKQRLGVAAALLGDPELVILDEPTNGLDPAGMADMRRLIAELAGEGRTVVLSSHLLAEVQEVCDRVGVIAEGRLIRESTVAELRGAATLRVRATPDARALAVAMRIAGDHGVRRTSGALELDLPDDAAPDLIRALVAEGLDVHEVGRNEQSLEDVFFDMTSGRAEPTDSHTSRETARQMAADLDVAS